MIKKNREIILASRPSGMASLANFKMIEKTLPQISNGEVLIRTTYLTVDPYMRGRMSEGPSYIEPFQINHPITGGIVGEVIESENSAFKKGDTVLGFLNWAEYNISDGKNLQKLNPDLAPVSTALGVLGMPGMTAYFGLLDIGKPKQGETVVVSGAAGAVGSLVGQIAKIKGCRVVGIAGGDAKIQYLTKELGFDAAVNYKSSHLKEDLKKACPKGVDVYFDNVGGDVSDAVLNLINKKARIIICGLISMYNLDKMDVGPRNTGIILSKSALMQGFIITDHADRYPEGIAQMSKWIKEGTIKYRESVIEGLENAPKAFLGLFKGENIGKQIVKI